ncbi:hypothetical protein ACS0TY_020045 [Phlomoides rotata]
MATNCIFLPATSIFRLPRRSHATITRSSLTDQSQSPAVAAKRHLLSLISDQDRGLKTQSDSQKLTQIIDAIDSLAAIGRSTVTTDKSLSATWRMLWTTEKEQLFIIKNASFFGTSAGDVLQVIDVEQKTLNNVITFPPDGVFFVRSDIQVASAQRVNFRFTSAVLRGKIWEFPLPPFGQGCFDVDLALRSLPLMD